MCALQHFLSLHDTPPASRIIVGTTRWHILFVILGLVSVSMGESNTTETLTAHVSSASPTVSTPAMVSSTIDNTHSETPTVAPRDEYAATTMTSGNLNLKTSRIPRLRPRITIPQDRSEEYTEGPDSATPMSSTESGNQQLLRYRQLHCNESSIYFHEARMSSDVVLNDFGGLDNVTEQLREHDNYYVTENGTIIQSVAHIENATDCAHACFFTEDCSWALFVRTKELPPVINGTGGDTAADLNKQSKLPIQLKSSCFTFSNNDLDCTLDEPAKTRSSLDDGVSATVQRLQCIYCYAVGFEAIDSGDWQRSMRKY